MANVSDGQSSETRKFRIKVLGRTLEHLGVQMYKRRDVALAELVANSWDAGATQVNIELPEPSVYQKDLSSITIMDNGSGMTAEQIQNAYLVIGRNRRASGQESISDRPIMGRKGVGKLAGFGIGRSMQIETWRDGRKTTFVLNSGELKSEAGDAADHPIDARIETAFDEDSASGCRVILRELKHKTAPGIDALHMALARRFGRQVKGAMKIQINGEDLRDPVVDYETTWPSSFPEPEVVTLSSGESFTWSAGFSKSVLPAELQGFTIIVNGKTAQAPPYFFGVENSASGQHGTKYLTGVIDADFLDAESDDESDRISTDRQEIDWDDDLASELKRWGEQKTRFLLTERVKSREDRAEDLLTKEPEIANRIAALDKESRNRVRAFIRKLGWSEAEHDKQLELADTIVRAFEYRQFHDFIDELEEVSNREPMRFSELVSHLNGWRVLESRAILEVVQGRMEILETFHRMLTDDSPETAHVVGQENLHDLVASFPWLINPDWQTFSEEKTISKQLREWGDEDLLSSDRTRYDFLALRSDNEYVVIEIKRASHSATLEDLQQLERYVEKLGMARSNISGLFISGRGFAMSERMQDSWKNNDIIQLSTWDEIHERARRFFDNYRALLKSDVSDVGFMKNSSEVARTRTVIQEGSYRGARERAKGVGRSDVEYEG